MPEYKVKFEVFEGPLDLLLYLVRKEEVDIYEVNLTKLATEFIEYVELMRQLDLDIAGEFLVMAATLMYIKSKELLPVDKQVTDEQDEEDAEDPRWELIRQLVEYKKFKDAAGRLQVLEHEQDHVYPRMPGKPEFKVKHQNIREEVSLFALVDAVNKVLQRLNQREDLKEIFEEEWTVGEKITFITDRIFKTDRVSFSSLFAPAATRTEVVTTFLALLELIRLKQIRISQDEPFGEIELSRRAPEPEENVDASDAEPDATPTES